MPRSKASAPAGAGFIKAQTTSTSVYNSKNELEKMLRRYGAQSFSVAQEFTTGRMVVMFQIPDTPDKGAKIVDVRFPVEVKRVYNRLYGHPVKYGKRLDGSYGHDVPDPAGYNAAKLEQAERVAWRNVILWVDAQLSAAAIGIQTVTESFIAHAALGPNGERLVDVLPEYLDSRRALRSGADS